MNHDKAQRRRRCGLALFAAFLALAVVAAPAGAKGPVLNPAGCPPSAGRAPLPEPVRAACERHWAARQASANRGGLDGRDAGIVAGSVAVLVLMFAGGMLVATHRRATQERRPAALRAADTSGEMPT